MSESVRHLSPTPRNEHVVFEEHLQVIAEQLAKVLRRSVIIDDTALRPLAVTPQTGKLDRSRVEAVLQRRTSARLRRKLAEHGVFSAREPVSIPGDPLEGILPRLCLPLLAEDQLLGFLWLIDSPVLTARQTQLARTAAAKAADLLAQRAILAADQFAMLSDLADGLLSEQPQTRQQAASMLTEQAALTGPPPYAVIVVRALPDSQKPGTLHRAAANLRLRLMPGSAVLASPGARELTAITNSDALPGLRQVIRRLPGPRLAVGTCTAGVTLADVYGRLEDARYAACVAARISQLGRAADWENLGVYAAFQHLYRDPAAPERICPGVGSLLAERTGTYRRTIRCYLEGGAQAQQAAAQLHIHRTTLYWRLARVTELTGLDLRSGGDRLKLHLALTLADLTHPSNHRSGRTEPR
jgi:PucR C-terminal helix-turn-helix domain